ncbi:c-type cytochrome [Methylomicrobium sp. Wu6]|uniref:c-type cytochrome n=1 Tax=Methylomicrobium sp. Wu6 TaxID=3107928 RepID=UPI002DD6B040|nr:c-type cytochrome [Methylomicrobium sp. Wu6]MEC4746926.1 c-type cytochrome [Methylomicrobium sp. Wu6]
MLRSTFLLVLSALIFGFIGNVHAADASAGAEVFANNCMSCHSGGKNLINPAKSLSIKDLKDNKMDSEAEIITLVTNGKPPMPAFGTSLSADQIKNIAAYVMQQANAGWK